MKALLAKDWYILKKEAKWTLFYILQYSLSLPLEKVYHRYETACYGYGLR
jgi:hypothetical protein